MVVYAVYAYRMGATHKWPGWTTHRLPNSALCFACGYMSWALPLWREVLGMGMWWHERARTRVDSWTRLDHRAWGRPLAWRVTCQQGLRYGSALFTVADSA